MSGNDVSAAFARINAAGLESIAVIKDTQDLTKTKASDAKGPA
jgi:hypothetical protein